jgi:hypothetical protein
MLETCVWTRPSIHFQADLEHKSDIPWPGPRSGPCCGDHDPKISRSSCPCVSFSRSLFFCLPVDPTETRRTYRAVFSEPRLVIPATSPAESAVPRDVVECDHSSEQQGVLTPSHTVEADGRQKKRTGDRVDAGRVRKKKKYKK